MLGGSEQLAKSTSLFIESAQGNLARGLQRLSTGAKLHNGAEDAGGLGVAMNIASKLKQSFKVRENVQNARSFLESQDGGYQALGKLLNRMSELRTKYDDPASNSEDNLNYNLEFDELQKEMNSLKVKKFNGVSLFSTDAKDPLSFFLPTANDGRSTQVTIDRTGFFDSLMIGSNTPASASSAVVNGAKGTLSPFTVIASPAGAVTNFQLTPATGSAPGITNATAATSGTTPNFQLIPAAGSATGITNATATASGTTPNFQLTPVAGSATGIANATAASSGATPNFQLIPTAGSYAENGAVTITAGTAVTTAKVEAVRGGTSATDKVSVGGGGGAVTEKWNIASGGGTISNEGTVDGSGNLYFVSDDGEVAKVDPATGGRTSLASLPGTTEFVTKPIIIGNDLFVGAQDNSSASFGREGGVLYKVNLTTGNTSSLNLDTAGQTGDIRGLGKDSNDKLYALYQESLFSFLPYTAKVIRIDPATLALDTYGTGGKADLPNPNFLFGRGAPNSAQIDPIFDSAGNLFVYADNTTNLNVYSFDNSGGRRTSHEFTLNNRFTFDQSTSPVISGDNLYFASDNSAGGAFNPSMIHGYDISGGGAPTTVFAARSLPGNEKVRGQLAVNGGNVYVSTNQGTVHAINTTTGAIANTFTADSTTESLTQPIVDSSGDLYVGSSTNKVYKITAATMTGDTAWDTDTATAGIQEPQASASLEAPPLLVGSTVYVGTTAGASRLHAFEAGGGGSLPASIKVGANYAAGDTPTVTMTTPGGGAAQQFLATGATPKVKVISQALIDAGTNGFDGAAYVQADWGKLDVDLSSATLDGNGDYVFSAPNGTPQLDLNHANTTLNDHGSGYSAGETVAFLSGSSSGITFNGTASATVDGTGKIDVDTSGITPTSTGTLTLAFDGPLQAVGNLTGKGSGYHISEDGVGANPAKPTITIANGTGDKGTLAATATVTAGGTLNITFTGAPKAKGTLNLTASNGNYFQIPADVDRGSGYANGATPAVTVSRGGTAIAGVAGSATAQADGKVDLTFTGNAGSATPVDVAVAAGTPAWTAPNAGGTYSGIGSGYHTSENPVITMTPPSGAGNARTVNATVSAADGSLSFTLPAPNETGIHTISAAGGTYFKIPATIDQGSGYANGATPAVTVTRGGTAIAGVAGSATAQPDGKVDLTFTGNAGSATAVDVTVAAGTAAWTAPNAGGTYSGIGSGYHTSENPVITMTPPSGAGNARTVNATVSAADGSLSFTLPAPNEAGIHTISAAGGTYFQVAAEADRGSGYANGATPAVTVTRGGTAIAGLTGSATAQPDGKVDLTFAGNAGSATAIDVSVAAGTTAWTSPNIGGTYSGIGSGYHTSENPVITITPPSGAGNAQTVNATVSAADGSLSFTLPAANESGIHTISAATGTYGQIPNADDQGSGYAPGATPNVQVQRGGVNVAGVTANAVADGSGRIDITFSGDAGAGAVDVIVDPGPVGFAQTSYTVSTTPYDASDSPVAVTITPPAGAPANVNATVVGGQLQFTLPAPTVAGTHTINAADGGEILSGSVNVGSGYAVGETPAFTVSDSGGTQVGAGNATINANGTANVVVNGMGNGNGPYTVNVAAGTVPGVQAGLDDSAKDLWDFSHADFEGFIQAIANVRAKNGATMNSLAFSESRLESNIQNLELAGGRIMDADMAGEMTDLAKHQILLQTATDSLTKHNKLSVKVDKTLMGLDTSL